MTTILRSARNRNRTRTPSRCRPTCPPLPPPGAASPLPGLLVVAAATAVAFGVSRLLPAVNPSTVAVVLGALAANLVLHRPVLHVGTHVASHRLLRIAVVLLGLQLGVTQLLHLGLSGAAVVVVTVAVTFAGTRLLGRLLGVAPARSPWSRCAGAWRSCCSRCSAHRWAWTPSPSAAGSGPVSTTWARPSPPPTGFPVR